MTKPWQAQERRIAKELGGTVTAASGALDRKGDVRAPEHLIEAKWTGKKSFTLKSEVLEKITREAMIEGRIPVLQIELNNRTYAVVDWNDWLEALFDAQSCCGGCGGHV